MIEKYKKLLLEVLDQLHSYDYIAFAWVGLLFLFLLILAILVRKRTLLSVFIMLLAFIILLLGPFATYETVRFLLYKTETKVTEQKQLVYSNALVVKGNITNKGLENISRCIVKTKLVKPSDNVFMQTINSLKPIKKKTTLLEKEIAVKQESEFKVIFEPFTYSKEFNITVSSECR